MNDDGELVIWDRVGPLHRPRRPDAEGVESLGGTSRDPRAPRRCGGSPTIPRTPWTSRSRRSSGWSSVVRRSRSRPRARSSTWASGSTCGSATTGDRRCYVSLLDIGVSGRVGILTDSSPSGEPLDPGGEYTFGFNDLKNVLQGQQLVWPAELERAVPRPETVIVLVTSQPQHIRGLEQHGVRSAAAPRPGGSALASPLERWFDQIASGGTRDIARVGGRSVRYTVRAVHFELVPTPPPRRGAGVPGGRAARVCRPCSGRQGPPGRPRWRCACRTSWSTATARCGGEDPARHDGADPRHGTDNRSTRPEPNGSATSVTARPCRWTRC